MLKKAQRLTAQQVRKQALLRKIDTPFFSLRVARNNYVYNRFGVVVSKKVDKKAVVRNRVKRVILSRIQQHNESTGGYDILITVKQKNKEFSLDILCTTLLTTLKKERLF